MDGFAHFWSHDTVSGLAWAIAQGHEAPDHPELAGPYNDLTQFVLRQRAQMPDYLRRPMELATLGFDVFGLLRAGKLFHGCEPGVRRSQIEAWKNANMGFQRDLIRYYESLATLALYSRPPAGAERCAAPPAMRTDQAAGQVIPEPPGELKCEIAVIGSGPGGAITACLLAEAGRDVLLIEEGPFYGLDSCEPFSKEEMLQKYRNGGQTVALGKNKVAYVEGRCVGGGSEINSGLYHRTPPEILEIWRREFQVQGLSEKELQPHFEACEKDISVSLLPGAAPAASLKLHDGAARLGWKSLEVPRWFRYENQASSAGKRQSMTQTFVPRFLRAGGRLLPGTRVANLRQENGRWILNAEHARGAVSVQAEALFVCGGAVQSPALLRRSGITRNIGDALRLHPTVKIVARFAEEVNSAEMGVPVHQVKEFSPRLSFGCSISSRAYLALGMIDHPNHAAAARDDWQRMANYYAMSAGESRGTVRTIAGFRDPLVRYQLTGNDRRDLADGLRKLAEILFASGATELFPSINRSRPLTKPDDLKRLPDVLPDGLANLMTIHLFSSCPMGENKDRCATDSFGRVHGFKNLRIADASLLCTAPGVNPQGSVMAFARRNALHFLSGAK